MSRAAEEAVREIIWAWTDWLSVLIMKGSDVRCHPRIIEGTAHNRGN